MNRNHPGDCRKEVSQERKDISYFLESEISGNNPEPSLFHVVPVPYEKTVSYGSGTAAGPAAVIEASSQLETFDGFSDPSELGIFTHPPVDCSGPDIEVLASVRSVTREIVQSGKIPVVIGGEHTVTYGAALGVRDILPELGIIQFDAHADLKESYEGSRFSHACVMKRLYDEGLSLYQLGVRSLDKQEAELRAKEAIPSIDAAMLYGGYPGAVPFSIVLPSDFPKSVYITVDVDGFDPSVIPATGTPEPGGILWYDFFRLVESIPSDVEIIGFDVVELAPRQGEVVSEFSTARLVYNLMGIIQRRRELNSKKNSM